MAYRGTRMAGLGHVVTVTRAGRLEVRRCSDTWDAGQVQVQVQGVEGRDGI